MGAGAAALAGPPQPPYVPAGDAHGAPEPMMQMQWLWQAEMLQAMKHAAGLVEMATAAKTTRMEEATPSGEWRGCDEVRTVPARVCEDYLTRVRGELGITSGAQFWKPVDYTRRIQSQFGKIRGLVELAAPEPRTRSYGTTRFQCRPVRNCEGGALQEGFGGTEEAALHSRASRRRRRHCRKGKRRQEPQEGEEVDVDFVRRLETLVAVLSAVCRAARGSPLFRLHAWLVAQAKRRCESTSSRRMGDSIAN